jgi:hypothetical protein
VPPPLYPIRTTACAAPSLGVNIKAKSNNPIRGKTFRFTSDLIIRANSFGLRSERELQSRNRSFKIGSRLVLNDSEGSFFGEILRSSGCAKCAL